MSESTANRILCMMLTLAQDDRKPTFLKTHPDLLGDLCKDRITAVSFLETVKQSKAWQWVPGWVYDLL